MKAKISLILVFSLIFLLSSCEKNLIGEPSSSIGNESSLGSEDSDQTGEVVDLSEEENRIDQTLWNLILVDNENKLPDDFTVTTSIIPSRYIINEKANKIDERILDSLMKMLDTAEEEGLKIRVTSAYRDNEYQKGLFDAQVEKNLKSGLTQEEAEKFAAEYVAIPGTSEHQTGLTVDLVSQDWFKDNNVLDATFEDTAEGKWLIENAYKYGFIMSFPQYQAEMGIIVINYEPWHYRYVGIEHAAIIKEKSLTLREYLYYY